MASQTNPSLEQATKRVVEMEAAGLVALPKLIGSTPEGLELAHHYQALASNAKKIANSTKLKIDRLLDDDTIPLASRQRQAREALAAGTAEVAKLQSAMGAQITVIKAYLKTQAKPRLDPAREGPTRDEIRTRVMGSKDPVGELLELARGDDELAACVTNGTFAESLLRGQGVAAKEAKEAVESIHSVAAGAASLSADPRRKTAAEALAKIGPTLGGGSGTYVLTRDTLDAAAEGARTLNAREFFRGDPAFAPKPDGSE